MKMQKETLCGRLNVEQFSDTILSKALSRLPKIGDGVWIAGGAVRRTFQCKKLESDFDFFFRDQEAMERFEGELIELGGKLLSQNDKNKKYILPCDVVEGSADPDAAFYLPEMEIQLINFQFFESPEAVIDSFDFTICQFAFDGEHFYIGEFSLWDLARAKLVVHKITYGVASVRRMMKYANQGFTVCGGCINQVLKEVAANPEIINSNIVYID